MTDETPRPDHAPDNANVVIHPPILWALLFGIGVGLDYAIAAPFVPAGLSAAWLGGAVWLAGVALVLLAVMQFRRAGPSVPTHTPTAAIVETGVYVHSRNPIYVGAMIGLLGAAIAVNSLWVLAMLVPFYLVIRHGVVAREEAYLERKFGAAYVGYKARVRRWV